jgi:hypothetical protein
VNDNEWLQQFGGQLSALTAPAGTALPAAPPPPPPPAGAGGPTIKWLSGAAPLLDVQAPQQPADPFGLMQPAPAPAPVSAAVPAGPTPSPEPTPVDPKLMPPTGVNPDAIPTPQPQAPPPDPSDVQFRPVGGGVMPAHEAAVRGPTQNAHLMASFEPGMQMADNVQSRSQWLAEEERNAYELQAAQALERQEAAQKVALQRQAQMERLAMDYEDQVQKLGQMHIDGNRWWASKSTGDKITTGILAFLGGLGALDPRGNGRNLAFEAIMRDADQDVEAQKFDAAMQQSQVEGARNTFQLAMQRYQNEDAATAAARAGAIDFSLAKLGQLQAQWKGVDAANAADDLRARLMSERERTIAAGIQFVPAKASPGKYQMVVRGQVLPGLVDEKRAQDIALEHGVKPSERVDEKMVEGGIQMSVAGAKANAEAKAKAGEHSVRLPSGEIVNAGDPATAKEIREAAVSVKEIDRLTSQAVALRKKNFRTTDREANAQLKQIQSHLLTQYGVAHKLGALSDADYKIALEGTADVFGLGDAPEAAMQQLRQNAHRGLSEKVGTIPGASPKASGEMPTGFTPHKKK